MSDDEYDEGDLVQHLRDLAFGCEEGGDLEVTLRHAADALERSESGMNSLFSERDEAREAARTICNEKCAKLDPMGSWHGYKRKWPWLEEKQ